MQPKIDLEFWSEHTKGLCPTCLRETPAVLFRENTKIWIEQDCLIHGKAKALIADDADEYLRLRQYVPPRVSSCCCGPGETCEKGKPPTCVLLLEITQACNLACPTCYADARGHDYMTLAEARERLDKFFAKQPLLDVLMISGGEPTIHPAFIEILDLVLSYPINRVLINTNGLRIAQSESLVAELVKRRHRIELYLSFSSFSQETHVRLYGKDIRAQKADAFRIAEKAAIFVNVVATLQCGVNDHELGDLFRFCLATSNICGLVLQPVMDTGRYLNDYDPLERTTLTGAIAKLCDQSNGMLVAADFVGLPCSHPDCAALTYGFLDKSRTVMSPLPRYLDISNYVDLFADRISFCGLLSSVIQRIFHDLTIGRGWSAVTDIINVLAVPTIRNILPLIGNPDRIGRRVFRVVVKPFMDAQTFDFARVDQCCTKIVDSSGEAVSFCEYNIFQRGRKVGRSGISLPMAKS
jgi:uncharacterized radical SAM superfamily Fe-S cluster-containing enzyme